MMKKFIRFWHQTCSIYTVSALLLLLFNLMISGTLSRSVINANAFLLLFLFAVIFTCANFILGVDRLHYALRVLLHFALTVTGVYAVLYLPLNSSAATSGKLMMLFLMMLVYWIAMGIFLAVRAGVRKVERKEDTYTGVFGAKK